MQDNPPDPKITRENVERVLSFLPQFIETLFSEGFVVPFDWGSWQEEAWRCVNDPDLLKDADLDTPRKPLTLHVRKDRFVEGHLSEMIDLGHMGAIL